MEELFITRKKQISSWIIIAILICLPWTMQGQVYNGDMNHDGSIDIGDVESLANIALGKQPKEVICPEGLIPEENKQMKILAIGNSFLESAMYYLRNIVDAADVDTTNICVYRVVMGSSSMAHYLDVLRGIFFKKYYCKKILGGIDLPIGAESEGEGSTYPNLLRNALTVTKWDKIIITQLSDLSANSSTWDKNGELGAYLDSLKSYQPDADIVYYIPYASYYWAKKDKQTTEQRSQNISEASKYLADKYGIKHIIPCATAIENLRKTSYNDAEKMTTDDHHLTYGLARFTAGCIFYQSVFAPFYGKSILGNPCRIEITESVEKISDSKSSPIAVTDKTAKYGIMSAYLADTFWNIIINPTNYVDYKEY